VCELSIAVAFSNRAAQAENCLLSLSEAFQANVAVSYEIVAIEAPSDDTCGEARARACGKNVRYVELGGTGPWRARALRLGVERCRAPWIGLMLDGAHILTPRVVEHVLLARGFGARPLIVVPEYVPADESRWQGAPLVRLQPGANEYGELLDHARFGPANPNGFLGPLLGASCVFLPRTSFDAVGAADARLDVPGGGALRFDLYARLSRLPDTRLVVLAGEAAMRQPHPEVTAERVREAESGLERLLADRAEPLPPELRSVHREPALFGPIPGPLQGFLSQSFDQLRFHMAVAKLRDAPAWYVDPPGA
jgi:hypothetical protein